ncbi:hypothetical protein AB2B46_15340 [Kluyvera intermedia]|uniref:hypothetical protein n=1 Tax=Kluyvera intermedia TaxID=61648 RepID=UPI0034A356EF
MKLLNIRKYKPEESKLTYGSSVEYYIDETGKDVYEHEPLFTKRWKILVRPETNIICSADEDITMLHPVGCDMCEVDELPDGFSIMKGYRFIDDKILDPLPTKVSIKETLKQAFTRFKSLK